MFQSEWKYNNSLIQSWIVDGNMLFFWLFLKEYNNKLYKEIEKKVAINQKGDFMIERTKYLIRNIGISFFIKL